MAIPKICGECKYHVHEDHSDGWVCANANSDYHADWTDYNDTCEEWHYRGWEDER